MNCSFSCILGYCWPDQMQSCFYSSHGAFWPPEARSYSAKLFCSQSTPSIQFLHGVGPLQWQDFTLPLVKLHEVLVSSLVIKQNLVYESAESCGSKLSTSHRFYGKKLKNIIKSEVVSPLPPSLLGHRTFFELDRSNGVSLASDWVLSGQHRQLSNILLRTKAQTAYFLLLLCNDT